MSVLMTMRVQGDAAKLEAEDPKLMSTIVDRAKQHGLLAHHFWGNDSEILIVDEWPDEASFQRFFETSPEIRGLMERAGVASDPAPTFWRRLETGDAVD